MCPIFSFVYTRWRLLRTGMPEGLEIKEQHSKPVLGLRVKKEMPRKILAGEIVLVS